MPELPEVETICTVLRRGTQETPSVVGKCITGAHLLWTGTLAEPSVRTFRSRIRGQRIREVSRRGKYIRIDLTSRTMLIHLRMSGNMMVVPRTESLPRFCRVYFDLGKRWRLVFSDSRKFGRVWLTRDPDRVLNGLGPEPLSSAFTTRVFASRLFGRSRQIKPLLLDQTFIAGVGNIYADESLHLAGIHPQTSCALLSPEQVRLLWRSVRRVLREGIRRQGASIDWIYRGGDFQNHFRVYQRTGDRCRRCGAAIERLVVGQRGTHICPQCQPLLPPGAARATLSSRKTRRPRGSRQIVCLRGDVI
ncbi:bifunctional DNA-formamidopyrimidine glycosylase/DNA-(apurinic or apyrimidinic site) lyase [Candidatus Eisenbacteria bacterium]|uniref:Bifunctional DNA-formamidopyrimidine glycosylase/DNA-(Apurinic or apyrimidinic site) lyase n=1 Tax=Eiseniibacteriota bacterium TaxID=2212470 RepID=A0ABV6YLZ5_UNCEI